MVLVPVVVVRGEVGCIIIRVDKFALSLGDSDVDAMVVDIWVVAAWWSASGW